MPRQSSASSPEDPEEELRRALDAAMHFLTARARSCHEVRLHLRKGGLAPEVVDRAEARLLELGLLDDAAFARAWVEEAVLRRSLAPARARAALGERGVAPEVIAVAFEDCASAAPGHPDVGGPAGDDEFYRAFSAATARLRVLHGTPESIRRRLWGFLARRGYGTDVIEQVCSRALPPE